MSLPNAVTNHVPRAANGMEQRPLETLVDLGAQPRNMHIDDVRLRIEMIVPDVFQQHGPRHPLPWLPDQIYQQPELACLPRQLILAARHPGRETVEFEIADPV